MSTHSPLNLITFNGKQQPKLSMRSMPTQFLFKKPMLLGPKYTNIESNKFSTTPLVLHQSPPPSAQKSQHNPSNEAELYKL